MEENKGISRGASTEKHDPGFVQLRRGLLEHLGQMSGNATKLYVWLLMTAGWKGPLKGHVLASFADVGRSLMFSSKTLQRACDELEHGPRPFIVVQRAANQYSMTRIRILRFDGGDESFGVDKFDQSKSAALVGGVDAAVDSGVDKFDHSDVHSSRSKSLESRDLRAPKKSEEVKNKRSEESDAVRRRFDAELHPSASKDFFSKPKSKASFEQEVKPTTSREAKLVARLSSKIRSAGGCYADYVARELKAGRPHPFGTEEQEAFEALKYRPELQSRDLSENFVIIALDVYEENRGKPILAGNLCSKVIDRIQSERESSLKLCGTEDGHYWPPDFQRHRNALRKQERQMEKAAEAKGSSKLRLSREEAQRWVDQKDAIWVDG
ncbi:MAG: hypothetical protein JO119_17460, partial [Acidobacteria bacterium]|nr:hypothetical protein [Acidobacteriota bacterium]